MPPDQPAVIGGGLVRADLVFFLRADARVDARADTRADMPGAR